MIDDFDTPQGLETDFRPDGLPATETDLADPLKKVRDLKRWVQIGVYSSLFCTYPFYYFIMGFSLLQLGVVVVIAQIIATTAIEGAFRQMFRLRKRSAYPGLIVLRLGGVETSAAAGPQALDTVIRLLRLRAAFLAHPLPNGDISLAAFAGLDRLEAKRLLQVGMINVRQALQSATPVPFQPAYPLLADAMLPSWERLMFVPVIALGKPTGVLAVIGPGRNQDLKDHLLLRGIGIALGLSLENLRQKEELREMAAIDELTRVYNRHYFFEQLEREIAEARRYNSRLAILLVDLDGLKRINDNYGHGAGDEALRSVAHRLVRHSRAADLVARLGGDEFAVILPRSSHQGAQEMAARLCQAVRSQPILLADGTAIPLAISCGMAAFPDDADDIEVLLRKADASMYAGKLANRKGQVKA